MQEQKITVMCPRDNVNHTVYYTIFNNKCYPNGCDFMNGSTDCTDCNFNVMNDVNFRMNNGSEPQ